MADNISKTDRTIDAMLGPSQARFQEFSQSLSGAGADAVAAWKSLQSFASGMPDVGKRSADSILALRANQELPREHRLVEGNERLAAAKLMVTKLNDGAHQQHAVLESALTTALLPAPHRDTSTRVLIRDEIRTRFSRLNGEELVSAVTKSLGTNELHDSEILGSFGSALLESAGASGDHVKAIRTRAVEKYLTATGGSKQQAAARKAIASMRELNIKGHIAAYHQAARMRLASLEDSPQSPYLQDARDAARDRKALVVHPVIQGESK